MPWWAITLQRYGFETYAGAGGTSNGIQFALFGSPADVGTRAAQSVLLCLVLATSAWLASRRFFAAAWLLAVLVLSRNSLMYPVPPLALLAGTAASVQGFIQTLGGGLVGAYIGQSFDGTTTPLAAGFCSVAFVGLLMVLVAERGKLFRVLHKPTH